MPASWTTTDESTVITTGLTVIDEQTNVTAQTVLSTTTQISECETFRADYGIISGCVCTLALVFGVIFCFFGWLPFGHLYLANLI